MRWLVGAGELELGAEAKGLIGVELDNGIRVELGYRFVRVAEVFTNTRDGRFRLTGPFASVNFPF